MTGTEVIVLGIFEGLGRAKLLLLGMVSIQPILRSCVVMKTSMIINCYLLLLLFLFCYDYC